MEGERMELRVLRYFLAVAREGTISGAACALHVTQPTLSRQMMELEEELGKTLFLRGKRSISLTEEGLFLRDRAREILALVEKTESEFADPAEGVCGDVYIGGGETFAMRIIARAACALQKAHPRVTFHLFSGNADSVAERIAGGLDDFGVFIEPADLSKYDVIRLPVKNIWGVLMRKDSPLASKDVITPDDLAGLPILVSGQTFVENEIAGWLGEKAERFHVAATYNLLFNASRMVEEGMGYALCLEGIVSTSSGSPFCFRPLKPSIEVGVCVAWKKYQRFSKASALFLEYLKKEI